MFSQETKCLMFARLSIYLLTEQINSYRILLMLLYLPIFNYKSEYYSGEQLNYWLRHLHCILEYLGLKYISGANSSFLLVEPLRGSGNDSSDWIPAIQ